MLSRQDGALANLQAQQICKRGNARSEWNERGGTKPRFENFERALFTLARDQAIHNRLATFLTVWHSGRGGMFGNAKSNSINDDGLIDSWLKRHLCLRESISRFISNPTIEQYHH
jgi:hypothetical protein